VTAEEVRLSHKDAPSSTLSAQFNGFVIPQGSTIFVNVCEFKKFIFVLASHHTKSVLGGIFHDPGESSSSHSGQVYS
jgi:hypothetical protein